MRCTSRNHWSRAALGVVLLAPSVPVGVAGTGVLGTFRSQLCLAGTGVLCCFRDHWLRPLPAWSCLPLPRSCVR